MKTNKTIPLLCCATTAVTAMGVAAPAAFGAPTTSRPNIVIILADDLGYGDIGCYGASPKSIPTPNIDRLAKEGRRFTLAYAPSATCTPSRYSLLTGEYPWRQPPAKVSILDADSPLAIGTSQPTIATYLRDAGYTTALIGKWHIGLGDGKKPIDFNGEIKPGPMEVGFDSAFFIPATLDRVPCVFIENHRVLNLDLKDPIKVSYGKRIRGADPVGTERQDILKYPADRQHSETIINGISRIGYMSGGKTALWVDEAIGDTLIKRTDDFIKANAKSDKPFFLYFGTHNPHVPRMPAMRFHGKSGAGIRGDSIMEMDWMVGQIVESIERAGIADNTLIIFTSDNGPIIFDGYYDGSVEANGDHKPAGGLRGWKYLRYEGGTRIPLITYWPGQVKRGTSDAMLSLLDIFPSLAALIGNPYPTNAGQDGFDMMSLLLGKTDKTQRSTIIQHGIGNVLALRDGNWKYVPKNADSATGIGSGADPNDKRFSDAIAPEDQLYNLDDDPAETKNLAKKYPDKLEAMRAKLEKIKATPGGEKNL